MVTLLLRCVFLCQRNLRSIEGLLLVRSQLDRNIILCLDLVIFWIKWLRKFSLRNKSIWHLLFNQVVLRSVGTHRRNVTIFS